MMLVIMSLLLCHTITDTFTIGSSDVILLTRLLPSDVDEPNNVEFSLNVDNIIAQESKEACAIIVLSTDHFSLMLS